MAEKVIDWDGRHLPQKLHDLAPGRYLITSLDAGPLSEEEDAAVRQGLDSLEAGDVVPLEEVIREPESRSHRP
jgi:hypothetical protein